MRVLYAKGMARIAILEPGQEPPLERFLAARPDTTMFLRSNLRASGLARDAGRPFEGTYAAAWDGGEIVAACAVYWNGKLLVEAPVELEAVVRAAAAAAPRGIDGILGPWSQAVAARAAVGLDGTPARLESKDGLYVLDLAALRVPAPLASGAWRCRHAVADDVELLARWRAAYHVEILGGKASPELDATAREETLAALRHGSLWVLEDGGAIVATTAFNAQLPDVVQVGGVYTPPELRARGYARAAVAGSLLEAAGRGVRRSILFTGDDNVAAQRAYLGLGYELRGDYALMLFA
jgi:RimJ/RimL family protein N-acetyltransferase